MNSVATLSEIESDAADVFTTPDLDPALGWEVTGVILSEGSRDDVLSMLLTRSGTVSGAAALMTGIFKLSEI